MYSSDVDTIRIAGIVNESIVDGPGIRYTIFVQGCAHKCKGCQNPQTHDFNGGKLVKIDDIINDIKQYKYIDGITLSGGDPFSQPKQCAKLLKLIKEETGLNVWCYTGFTFEELMRMQSDDIKEMLENIDVLVDGRYVEELSSLELRFRGSSNQRIIDIPKTLTTGHIAELKEYYE
jgi:anaerobic ribonucleoside-triphosphate reductase activating protein